MKIEGGDKPRAGKMKKLRLNNRIRSAFRGGSGGMTLIEVLVALALFGIIAIVFAGGLGTASRAVLTGDIRATAESLARTQMEYVKSQRYSPAPWDYEVSYSGRSRTYDEPEDSRPIWWDGDDPPLLGADYAGYTARVEAADVYTDEPDIQEITVTVSHEGRRVISLVGYNVDRKG